MFSTPPLSSRWPVYSLWLLIGAAALNRYTIRVAGLSVFPEYVALAIALAIVLWAVARRQMTWHWPRGTWLLAGWLAIALLASFLNAPKEVRSLILWNKLWMMVATYLIVANLTRGRLKAALNAQLAIGTAVVVFGLLAVVLWRLARIDVGTEAGIGGTHAPYGTLREVNIWGSYVLAVTLLALPIATTRRRRSNDFGGVVYAVATLGIVGVVVSLTRAVWVGFVVSLGAIALVGLLRRPRFSPRKLAIAGAGVLVVAATLMLFKPLLARVIPVYDPSHSGDFAHRVASFGALDRDPDLEVRSAVTQHALKVWRERPWIGWGVGAMGDMYTFPTDDQPAWISNLFVHHLFDSGIVGLSLLVAGVVLVVWRGVIAWKQAQGMRRTMLGGLLLAILGLLVAFQATEASWLAYPWIYLGMLEGGRDEVDACVSR